jgi:hypothetical protein
MLPVFADFQGRNVPLLGKNWTKQRIVSIPRPQGFTEAANRFR